MKPVFRKLAVLCAIGLAGACAAQKCQDPVYPDGGIGGSPSFGGSAPVAGAAGMAGTGGDWNVGGQAFGGAKGTLEERACTAASAKCGVDYTECLRQVNQLRRASYATLSDASLRCWIDQPTKTAILSKCGNGVCR